MNIDGNAIARKIRENLATQAKTMGLNPGLAVIIVGDNPASKVYVGRKMKACQDAGWLSKTIELPSEITQDQLLAQIDELNEDNNFNGILVQLPLPKHINYDIVLDQIKWNKDVDGFGAWHLGRLVAAGDSFWPCTPRGCLYLLDHHKVPISGQNAVVVGRSNIVGKPMALMLINRGATVTVCNSKTTNLAEVCQQADILVAAVGKPKLITGDMIKPGATVLDVGINRLEDGSLCGDVDYDSAAKKAGLITPVPGGVGPMTIAMLLDNTYEAALLRPNKPKK